MQQFTLPTLCSVFLKGARLRDTTAPLQESHRSLQKIHLGYMSTERLDDYICGFLVPPTEGSLHSAVISLRLHRLYEMELNTLNFRDALYNQIELFCNVRVIIQK